MKICSTCKKKKSISSFSFFFAFGKFYQRSYCVECFRAYSRGWKKRNRKKQYEYSRRWIKKNKKKHLAHSRIAEAIKSGKLKRQPCQICGKKAHAHHDNYNEPLKVKWFCNFHHKQIHN